MTIASVARKPRSAPSVWRPSASSCRCAPQQPASSNRPASGTSADRLRQPGLKTRPAGPPGPPPPELAKRPSSPHVASRGGTPDFTAGIHARRKIGSGCSVVREESLELKIIQEDLPRTAAAISENADAADASDHAPPDHPTTARPGDGARALRDRRPGPGRVGACRRICAGTGRPCCDGRGRAGRRHLGRREDPL